MLSSDIDDVELLVYAFEIDNVEFLVLKHRKRKFDKIKYCVNARSTQEKSIYRNSCV